MLFSFTVSKPAGGSLPGQWLRGTVRPVPEGSLPADAYEKDDMVIRGLVNLFNRGQNLDRDVKNEISVIIGYPFKPSSDATAEIGATKFAMYTQNDGAWIKNAA